MNKIREKTNKTENKTESNKRHRLQNKLNNNKQQQSCIAVPIIYNINGNTSCEIKIL